MTDTPPPFVQQQPTTPLQQQSPQQKADASAAWLAANHPDWNQNSSTPQQAAATNAAYLNNSLPVLPAFANQQSQFYTPAQILDNQNEIAKHNAAFGAIDYGAFANVPLSQIASRYGSSFADRVQGHYTENPTPLAQSINAQYNQQHQIVNNPFDPDSASGIAFDVAKTGGTVGQSVAAKSDTFLAKYGLALPATWVNNNIEQSTVPLRDLSATGPALRLTSAQIGAGASDKGITTYVPYGSFTQEAILNTKDAIDKATGEIGVYQLNKNYGTWDLISGGGRAALQSGMFTYNKAETPYVTSQWGAGTYVLPSGEGQSRLGAEAYGGVVRELNGNLLASNEAMARYNGEYGQFNLANFVNQVPAGKAEASGAAIPWSIAPGSPNIQYMNDKGLTGEAINIISPSLGATPKPFISASLPAVQMGGAPIPAGEQTVTKGSVNYGNILNSPLLVGLISPLMGGSLKRQDMVGGVAVVTGGLPGSLAAWGAGGGEAGKWSPVQPAGNDLGAIISKGPLSIFGAPGWAATALYDYMNPAKAAPAGQEYVQRHDAVATVLSGGVEAGDVLFKPLVFFGVNIHPGQDLLTAYGQTGSPVTAKYNADIAAWQSQSATNDVLGNKIAGEQGSLKGMLNGKVNSQGQFTGNDIDYMQVQSQTSQINKDVATYNAYGTKGQNILTEGFSSGAILPTGNGGYIVNPDTSRTYGAFSDWSNSAQKMITGSTPAQFALYEQSPEFKNSNLAWAATEGIFKAVTNPERMMSTTIQGAELYVGFSALGGAFGAMAPEAGAAPVGLTQHIGAIGGGVLQSNILTYGLLAAFGTGSVLQATNNFKNSAQQSASNLGGTFVDYTTMFGVGFGLEAAPHGVDYVSTRFAEKPMSVENAVYRFDVTQRPDVQVPSGVGGSLSYTEYHEMATQPSLNLFGHEIAFPRIFSPVDRPDMAWGRTVELGRGDIGSLLNARLPGTEAEPLVSSRVENLRLESFRSQELSHGTGDVRIGEVRLPHTIAEYLKMGAADARLQGVSQEEAAASLMADATKVTQPTTGYRLPDVNVPKGTNIREAFDWTADLQGGTSHELNQINLENFFGSMKVTQTGGSVYKVSVTRDMQGSPGGQYDVSGSRTPENRIISQLQETSKNLKAGPEHGMAFDKRGNLIYTETGELGSVARAPVEDALNSVGGGSMAHEHPPYDTGSWLGNIKYDVVSAVKRGELSMLLEGTTRSKLEVDLAESRGVGKNPSKTDMGVFASNNPTVDSEYIVSSKGVTVIRQPSGGWGTWSTAARLVPRFFEDYTPTDFALIKSTTGGFDFVGKNEPYSGPGYTERVTDASIEMRNAFPEGVRDQFVNMIDRMTLKNPNMEFIREPAQTTTEIRGGGTRGGLGGSSYASPLAQQMSVPAKPLYDYTFANKESATKEVTGVGRETVFSNVRLDTSINPLAESKPAFRSNMFVGQPQAQGVENVRAFSPISSLDALPARAQRPATDNVNAFSLGSDLFKVNEVRPATDTVRAFVMGSSLALASSSNQDQKDIPVFAQFTPQNQQQTPRQQQTQYQQQIQQQPAYTQPWSRTVTNNPPPPITPIIPGFPAFPYGSAGAGGPFGRKRYGMFHEYLKTVNYNAFNVRTGQGAKLPSLVEKKGQGINFTNVSHAAKGDKFRTGKGLPKGGAWINPSFKAPAKKGRKKK